jgi:type VI secretion system protein ImpA
MPIDVDKLLRPIAGDNPCGADVRYDPEYAALMELAKGKPEQEIIEGSGPQAKKTLVPGEEPPWAEVRRGCEQILGRSKALRVGLFLSVSMIRLEGYPGLAQGMALLHGLITTFWDRLYPELDPDDPNPALERINIIASMATPPDSYGDVIRFQNRILESPITESVQVGRFSLRDIENAQKAPSGEAAKDYRGATPALVDAAFQDTAAEHLQGIAKAIATAKERLNALDTFLTEKCGAGKTCDLGPLKKTLTQAEKVVGEQVARKTGATAEAGAPGTAGAAGRSGAARMCSWRSTRLSSII